MKKIIVFLNIVIIMLVSIPSFSFVDKRFQWWKIRNENIEKELSRVKESNKYDKLLVDILENDIKRSKKILHIFNLKNRGINNLTEVSENITEKMIENHVNNIAIPGFSIYYLHNLLFGLNNQSYIEESKKIAEEQLYKLFADKFEGSSRVFVKKRISARIPANLVKYLSFEIFTGTLMDNYRSGKKNFVRDLKAKVKGELKQKNQKITSSELREIIIKAFNSLSKETLLSNREKSLNESWVWQTALYHLKSDIKNYNQVKNFLQYSKSSRDIESLQYYYENPMELEEIAFKGYLKRLLNKEKYIKNSNSEDLTTKLKNPTDPDMISLFKDIDMLRKTSVRKITGKEEEAYFGEMNQKFNKIIKRYMGRSGSIFFKGYKKLQLLSTDEITEEDIKKKKEIYILPILKEQNNGFLKSRQIYFRKLYAVRKYKTESVKFIRWVSMRNRMSADDIYSTYKYRIKRNKQYLDFISLLEKECSTIADVNDKDLKVKYQLTHRRIPNFFKALNYTLSLSREYLPHLTKNHIRKISNLKKDYRSYAVNTAREISLNYRDFIRNMNNHVKKQKKLNKSIGEKIAQYEAELLYESISEYSNSLDKLTYADRAFKNYGYVYNGLYKSARDGAFSPDLDDIIRDKSLIKQLKNFDEEKIIKEFNTKKYLKNILNRDLAKLVKLSHFYKRNKIQLASCPDRTEHEYLKQKINHVLGLKVSSWQMTEKNFQLIDKKAVKKLFKLRNIYIWNSNPKKTNVADNPDKKNSIENLDLSIKIPQGWTEVEMASKNPEHLKSFSSLDNKSSIDILYIPLKNNEVNITVENWNRQKGRKTVKTGSGSFNNFQYYWSVSKDKKNNITEIYAVKNNNMILILSGSTAKKLYPFFRNRINKVFKSLEFVASNMKRNKSLTYINLRVDKI